MTSGSLKISVSVSDWPFCDPSTAPTHSNQETPSTVCTGASLELETGAYLDATLIVRGPSSSIPVLHEGEASSGGNGDTIVDRGLKYLMSGGNADATLTMSEWVKTHDYGWTKV